MTTTTTTHPASSRPRASTPVTGDRNARRFAPRELATLALLLLLLAVAVRAPGFVVDTFNTDESLIATQAEVIRDGGDLYEEAVDRKPPLVPYVYAAAFTLLGTTGLWAARLAAAVAVALAGVLLAIEARERYGRRASWVAGVLLVLSTAAFVPQDGQAANFEIFMLPGMVAAILLARRGRPAGAGVAVAAAALAKQTGAAALLPVLYLVWRHGRKRGVTRALVGFAVPLLLAALALGPSDLFFWTVLGNGDYVSIGSSGLLIALVAAAMTALFVALQLPVLWTLPRAWRERAQRRDTDLWLWVASGAVSILVGLRFFGHYYLQLLPPLCLLTAGMLTRESPERVRRTLSLALVVAAVCTAAGFVTQPFEKPRYETAAAYVADRSAPTDRILVWGHVPEIYHASGAKPATRFLTTRFLTGSWSGRAQKDVAVEDAGTPGAWDLFLGDFRSHPPRFILDAAPAKIRESEHYPISIFPQLAALVERDYRLVRHIDGIAVYERRPGAAFETLIW